MAEVTDFKALPGNGLKANLLLSEIAENEQESTSDGSNIVELLGGSQKFITSQIAVPTVLKQQADSLASQGKTPLFFAQDKTLLGIIAVADVIKEDSPQAVRELQNMGIKVVMLTGDNEQTAKAIGAQAGVDEVIAGVLPDGKEAVIRKL